jgi:hypothetical protein
MMMYSRGPVIKSGFKYNGDNGTQGNRGTEDALQKDWPALFAKAMNIKGCPAWVGTTNNHNIFLTQADVSQKKRSVENIDFVKKDNGCIVGLSRIQSGNEDMINAVHLIFSGSFDESALLLRQDSEILNVFQKDGRTNVILMAKDEAYVEGGLLNVLTDENILLENVMLAKTNGREIYPDLSSGTEAGPLTETADVTLEVSEVGMVDGHFEIVNKDVSTLSATLILSVYDAENFMTNLLIKSIAVEPGSIKVIDFPIQSAEGDKVKGFIWGEDFVPLCAGSEYTQK